MPSGEETEFSPTPRRSSIIQNFGHLLSSQLVTWALSTIVAIVVPRHIGPVGQGQLRLGLSLWAIAQAFAGLGTGMYLSLQVARDRARGLSLVGPVIVLRVLAFTVTLVPLAIYTLTVDMDEGFVFVLVVLGAGALLDVVTAAIASVMMGLEQMGGPARALVISKTLWAIGVCVSVMVGGGVEAVVVFTLIGSVVNVVLVYRLFRRIDRVRIRGWGTMARVVVVGSLGFFAANAILIVYQQLDTIVIAVLVDQETLGWYATADSLFGSMLFLPTVTVTALYPVMGRLFVHDRERLDALIDQTTATLLVAAIPIGVGVSIVGPNLAPLLFGEEFSETGQVLVALGPVISLVFFTTLLGSLALATDRRRFWNLLMVAATALTIPLDILLVPWADARFGNGAIGGALAYVVTESMMLVVGVGVIAPKLMNRRLGSRLARTTVAAGAMTVAAWPLRDQFLLIPVAVAIAVYGGVAYLVRVVSREEIDMMRGLVRGHEPITGGSV